MHQAISDANTRSQLEALNAEVENLGFEVPDFVREEFEEDRGSRYSRRYSWRREFVKIRGKAKSVYRDLKTGRVIKKSQTAKNSAEACESKIEGKKLNFNPPTSI